MGGYAKYIATREGVEKIDDSQRHAPATIKQQELIMRILRDFPDAKESHEYEDYRREKTVGNASEFITRALEENMDRVADSKTYADYIATRPRAERFGSHPLLPAGGRGWQSFCGISAGEDLLFRKRCSCGSGKGTGISEGVGSSR